MTTFKRLSYLALLAGLCFTSCSKSLDKSFQSPELTSSSTAGVKPLGATTYSNGFFVINEGWYSHGTGEVNFYNYSTSSLQDSIFGLVNAPKNLNPATSTLEYGTIFNGNLYLVSKVGGPLVVTDPNSLVESARIAASSSNDWRAFLGLDATHGLISSGTGVYPVSLPGLTVGTKLSATQISGECGDMIKSGNFIFILTATQNCIILNASTKAFVKSIAGVVCGFAETTDGSVWCAGGTTLTKIDSSTLATTSVTLPFTVASHWDAWNPGSITASTAQNAVFIVNNITWMGGKQIYKYVVGNPSSLSSPFINIATGKETYGKGIGYDASNDHLVVTTVLSGGTTNYFTDDLVTYNASTGTQLSDVAYTGYWFPAMMVFH